MPTSSSSERQVSGSWFRLTPSASKQSAVPHCELAARLPCLATLAPAAVQRSAVVVEILKVFARSPPVPTISSTSMPGCSTGVANSRMAAAQPLISSMVSALVDFVESAAKNAAFCVAVVSPLMISVVRSSFMTIFSMASRIMVSPFLGAWPICLAETKNPPRTLDSSKDGPYGSRCHLGSGRVPHFLDANTSWHVTCALRRSLLGQEVRSVRPLRPIQRPASRSGSHHPGLAPRACSVYLPHHRFVGAMQLGVTIALRDVIPARVSQVETFAKECCFGILFSRRRKELP